MKKVELLQQRLQAIADSVREHPDGLALIGLGSVGKEIERIDEYSDLDFYAIVKDGCKEHFVEDVSWLESIVPVVFKFQNTDDGYKLLYKDGVFCEFGVYTLDELEHIGFNEGRVIWADDSMPLNIAIPKHPPSTCDTHGKEFLLGELLTNLYVGLCRFHRGEKCSAMRFVQVYAIDRLIALMPYITTPTPSLIDGFSPDRRLEQRYPEHEPEFSSFMQGYEKSPESAKALLEFVAQHFEVNKAIEGEILALV